MTELLEKPATELTKDELQTLLNRKLAEENAQKRMLRDNYEAMKRETIEKLVPKANALSEQLKNFKALAFGEMEALYSLLCSYSKRHADGKGNFEIETPEGMKITYSRQDLGYFDERSNQAEKHIIQFVNSYFKDDANTKELITTLLERKKDKLDVKMVQKLYSMEDKYDNENWREGIRLLKESWTPSETKSYITFKVKANDGWQLINLNFASI